MELLVKINKKLEQRRAILNTIIQNVGICLKTRLS